MSITMLDGLFYRVSNQPEYPEAFRNLPSIQHHTTTKMNFNVNICVRFVRRCSSNHIHPINFPSPLISSHYISCNEFFNDDDGPDFLRSNLSHELLPPEMLDRLIPTIISCARQRFSNDPPCPLHFKDCFIVFPLAIDVLAELIVLDMIEAVSMLESMQQVRMTPASKEAILSLRKMKLQEGRNANDIYNSQCCICLEDFHDDVEVSTMPCHHVFHQDCIVQWLKTSHFCPLCRYSMPTENNS